MADRRQVKIDILGDASSARKAFGDAGSSADGFGSKLGGIGKAAIIGLAGVGVAATGMAVSFVKAAAESQKVMAQTEAVIKSTGGAAGLRPSSTATEWPWLARISVPSALKAKRCLSLPATTRRRSSAVIALPWRARASSSPATGVQPAPSNVIPTVSGW